MLSLNSPDRNRDDTVTVPSLRDPVALNVGGELYSTTLDTLTRCRESMLGAMFTGQISSLRDRQGNVFIDRDGRLFRYVLNFLRSGSLDLPRGFSELALLRREADFYQIRPLLEEVRRYEEARPLCEGGGPPGAMLVVEVDCKVRVLHFNLRRAGNYELCTCSVRVLTAELFCTWRAFLLLLCGRLSYWTPQGLSAPQLAEPRQNRVRLEWVPRPEELPQEQYNKLLYRGLIVTDPETSQTHPGGPGDVISERRGPCEVTDTRSFVEELLTVSLAEGFRVESVTPDPADILNCSSLRLVRS